MDHTANPTVSDGDEIAVLLKHILSLLEQAKLLSGSILGGNRGQFMSLDDLQQAVFCCKEKLAAQNPNHPVYSTTCGALDTLEDVTKTLSLFASLTISRAKQQKNASATQILFEKWEIDVDDIEAPLPNPFDDGNNFGEALVGETRNRMTPFEQEGNNTDGDAPWTEEKAGQTVEVQGEAEEKQKKAETKRTKHKVGPQENLLAEWSEQQLACGDVIAIRGPEHNPGVKIVGAPINSRIELKGSGTPAPLQDSLGAVGESIANVAEVSVAKMGMSVSNSPIKIGLGQAGYLDESAFSKSSFQLDRLEPAVVDDLLGVLAAMPMDSASRVTLLNHLAFRLSLKYKQTRAMDDLRQAITYGEETLVAMPRDYHDRAGCLTNLADGLVSKYINERTETMDDLHRAIIYGKEALAAMPQDHLDRVRCLSNLANALDLRVKRAGAMEDLQNAIAYSGEALAATPQNHPNRIALMNNLAASLSLRYELTGALEDLQQAITNGKEVLAATPQDHPDRVTFMKNLAQALGLRYKRIGTMDDLQQSIMYCEMVLEVTPDSDRRRSRHARNLSDKLGLRYERTGCTEDLRRAILCGEDALALAPQGRQDRADCLTALARVLNLRYQQTRVMDDLHQAAKYQEEALAATPQDHPNRAHRLGRLASSLGARYSQIGAIDDLQRAITYNEEALTATPRGHPDRAAHLNNLAADLHLRYKRTRAVQDLQQAIMHNEEALATAPKNRTDRAVYLDNLVALLGSRFSKEGTVGDLEQAILYGKEALVEYHPDRAHILSNMAVQLNSRYHQKGDVDDLMQAIMYGEEALAATPRDHPDRAGRLCQLADSLRYRSLLSSSSAAIADLSNSILYLREACSCNMSPPYIRILAAQGCVNLSCQLQLFKLPQQQVSAPGSEELSASSIGSDSARGNAVLMEDASLLENAVLLLPQVSPKSLERKDQQHHLKALNGIGEAAASFSLLVGKTGYQALKLLELSRGVIIGSSIDCRSDLSDLKAANIDLFNKFNDLRSEVDNPLPEYQFESRSHHDLQRREKTICEMEKTIAEIRGLPGHEGFQLPPSQDALMSMAKDGPIVVFISSIFQSNAIIVTSSTINSIELPMLTFSEIPERLGKITELAKALSLSKYISNNKKMLDLLSWLWDVAVGPVIQSLQLTATTEDADLTHIWWIGVGVLSVAPFHAAGHYSRESDPSQRISSYAISSYTPTIKALSYARERGFTISNGTTPDAKILLVTMQETPYYKDLPNAIEEVAKIVSVAEVSAFMEYLEQPNAKDILDRLQSCHTIHFACHGISDKDPSNSHLVLLKDGIADKLTVQDVSRKNTKTARLAYLSACSTAKNDDIELADEAIHIASGFQLAGFSHVLATMWEANSKVCTDVSTEFYSSLFSMRGAGGHREVALAFYRAVSKARVNNLQQPLKWAPFIHMGA